MLVGIFCNSDFIQLMKIPVLLPSGNIVDRVNIVRHLLNNETDPFTRQKMTTKDLVEQTQLQQEIQTWKKKRLEELKKGDKEIKYGKIEVNQKERD